MDWDHERAEEDWPEKKEQHLALQRGFECFHPIDPEQRSTASFGYSAPAPQNVDPIVSPFAISAPAKVVEESAATVRAYTEFKRSSQDIMRQCAIQNVGFQLLIFEVVGGYDMETASFLNGLHQEYDSLRS